LFICCIERYGEGNVLRYALYLFFAFINGHYISATLRKPARNR
jgi:hypothetical protein